MSRFIWSLMARIDNLSPSRRIVSLAFAAVALTLASCDNPSGSPTPSSGSSSAQIAYDTPIKFGTAGNSASIKVNGWSKAEEQFTWTEGNTATLSIPVAPTEARVTLRVRAAGMIKEPEFPTHPVEVLVNDRKVADWQVGNTAPFTAAIPPELTKSGGKLAITFNMPKAVSPKELGKNEDPRVLGMCVHDLELSTK